MMLPRIKILVVTMLALFTPPEGNIWLQFGQLSAIVFISWLVIKRGTKSGDQDVAFWQAQFTDLKNEISKLHDEVIRMKEHRNR